MTTNLYHYDAGLESRKKIYDSDTSKLLLPTPIPTSTPLNFDYRLRLLRILKTDSRLRLFRIFFRLMCIKMTQHLNLCMNLQAKFS